MNDVLKALDRNEKVTVFYRGKVKGVLIPPEKEKDLKIGNGSPGVTETSVVQSIKRRV